jgi:hypothetical protein
VSTKKQAVPGTGSEMGEFRGQTGSMSERNRFIIKAEGGNGFLEGQFSGPRAAAYGECMNYWRVAETGVFLPSR